MKMLIQKILGKEEAVYRNPLMMGDLRNEPCVCNSGRKLKHCHGNKYHLNEKEMSEVMGHVNRALATTEAK